jgi:4,5-dihydroxyphthalate decarboxylase
MSEFPATGPVTLKTNLADYPVTRAVKAGEVSSPLIIFDFCGPKVANQGFKPMVREGKFDAGELAICTFLQAKIYNKPFIILPAVVMARFQHHTILYNASRGELKPKDLEGRRVAIRSYTQTTGVWVRGILQHEYGVDLRRVRWACMDDAHLAEYKDPAFVERLDPKGKPIDQMLVDGDVDAAIIPTDLTKDHAHIRHLFPNPHETAKAWAKKHGVVPINHVFAVKGALADARPEILPELFRVLLESKKAAPPSADGIDFHPFGLDACRAAFDMAIRFSVEQEIIPHGFTVDELFDERTRKLKA